MSIKLPAAWFPLALVGLSGLGLGLFIGMPLGLGDAASLRGQLAKKAAENAALDGERNKLQGTIADLTAALDAAKLPPRDKKGLKSSSPAGADWKPAQEFARSYGPCSGFARFAQRLEGTKAWNASSYWSARGNDLPGLWPEAIGLQLYDPATQNYVCQLSVSFPPDPSWCADWASLR